MQAPWGNVVRFLDNHYILPDPLKGWTSLSEVEVRLILIGERFFHNFQSLEIIGDMYQHTEAF